MSQELRERKRANFADLRKVSEDKSSIGRRSASLKISLRILTASLLFVIVTYWLLLIDYFERQRHVSALRSCAWEHWENWEGSRASNRPHRIAILADPQLVDDHTYPKHPRIVEAVLRKMSDFYLHYNYMYLNKELDPDTTIFIGDLFDGGRDWEDQQWIEEFQRFNRIFPKSRDRKTYRGLPGNHDIGFQNISVATRERFAAHFGESNDCYILGNHTFLQLDTISYSHEDPEVHTEAREYVESIKDVLDESLPRIILTHVPFFRDPNVEVCGPGRESKKPFPLMRGVQYQTVIEHWVSDKLLKELNPVIVFSGDDHDYCDMTHLDYDDTSRSLAREISCKSPSMTNGIRYPAYQLLSLNNPQDTDDRNMGKTYETEMCYLPTPYLNVKVYLLSYVLTCVAIWVLCFRADRLLTILTKKSFTKSEVRASPLLFILHCILSLAGILYILSIYYHV